MKHKFVRFGQIDTAYSCHDLIFGSYLCDMANSPKQYRDYNSIDLEGLLFATGQMNWHSIYECVNINDIWLIFLTDLSYGTA